MKLITDQTELTHTFKRLCSQYNHYKWAVAWAGDTHTFFPANILNKNRDKIDQIVIGLHFYQTSPNFIEEYMDEKGVRFYMQSDGIFHAKMYLFYNNNSNWEAIVGSSNFTRSGFDRNIEANILFSNHDEETSFAEMSNFISSIWNEGEYFDKTSFLSYKESYKLQYKKKESLKKLKTNNALSMSAPLDVMSWEEYVSSIMTEDNISYLDRLEMLSKAQELFSSNKQFDSFEPEVKRGLAGFIICSKTLPGCSFDWRMFGSMMGAGSFKKDINKNLTIGKALDKIPIKGDVTKKQFEVYCKAFENFKNPIAQATRLLAVKRPDLFVCINNKNRKEISRLLNIPQSHITLDNYWGEILMSIYDSVWFNDKSKIKSNKEKQIKKYQVAMLDSISYKY